MLPVNHFVYLWILPIIGLAVLWYKLGSDPEWSGKTLGLKLATIGAVLSLVHSFLPPSLPSIVIFIVQLAGTGLFLAGLIAFGIAFYNKQQEI